MNTLEYIEKNKDRFLNELFELLKEPSISADPAYSKNVFTETTTFEKIRNNHPCIKRLEIYACKRLVSITYIK